MKKYLALAALGAGGLLAYQYLKPRYDFRGKTVLLTGGARGLGLLLARQLADAGARLCICSRTGEELGRARDELSRRGADVLALVADVTERDQVREVVARARQRFGPIDVLINNAGVIGVGPVELMTVEDFEQAMRTHFWGSLYAVLEVLPEMRARKRGRIVNVASIGGKVAVPHLLPYTASKFALVGLSEGLRAELASSGVVVTTVCPGMMRTGSHLHAEFKGQHEKEYAWFAAGGAVPLFSVSGESAARQILAACGRGDAELIISLPAKLAVALNGIFPNLTAELAALADHLLPEPGGIGTRKAKGHESRGLLPPAVTALSDRAAERNNETTGLTPAAGRGSAVAPGFP